MSSYVVSDNASHLPTSLAGGVITTVLLLGLGGGLAYGVGTVVAASGFSGMVYVLAAVAAGLLGGAVWLGLDTWAEYRNRTARARLLQENADRPWIVRPDWEAGRADAKGADATFELDTLPGVLGETLEGDVILRDADLGDASTAEVTLSCVYERFSGDDDHRGDQALTSWRDEAIVSVHPHGSGAVRLPVSFALPVEAAPATPDPQGRPRVDWKLEVDAGTGSTVTFEVPVFARSDRHPGPGRNFTTPVAPSPSAPSIEDASSEALPASRQRPEEDLDRGRSAAQTSDEPDPESAVPDPDDLPSDDELTAAVDGIEVTSGPNGELHVTFHREVLRYGRAAGPVIMLVFLLGLHGLGGYVQAVMGATGWALLAPQAALGLLTLFVIRGLAKALRARLDLHVANGRVQYGPPDEDPYVKTACENVASVTAVVADPEQPRDGYALRLHCREPLDLGALHAAVGTAGEALGSHAPYTGHADPRRAPDVPVLFPKKADAERIATRIEAALRHNPA